MLRMALRYLHLLRKSPIPQAIMMKTPIRGIYVYLSAIDWWPTCTSPITGTRVPRYQNHPTGR